jgi:hypothetical protein
MSSYDTSLEMYSKLSKEIRIRLDLIVFLLNFTESLRKSLLYRELLFSKLSKVGHIVTFLYISRLGNLLNFVAWILVFQSSTQYINWHFITKTPAVLSRFEGETFNVRVQYGTVGLFTFQTNNHKL